ncbi:MAG: transposase, partial [Verrucomicrobiales bacterium]|nr:transposase [Verrucomicrobiales bacterium]
NSTTQINYEWSKKAIAPQFQSWFQSAIHTKLEPVKKVARMLKKHLPGLLAYVRHRITNATAEGINSKIQMLKSNARGLPKFRTLRIRVLFHCGGLDLSPHTI